MHELTFEALQKELKRYAEQKAEFREMFDFYSDVMKIVIDYREKVKPVFKLEEDELKDLLRKGEHLLSKEVLEIDPQIFKEVRDRISEVISLKDGELGIKLNKLWGEPALSPEKMIKAMEDEGGFTTESLEKYFKYNELTGKCGEDFELVSFVIFSALSPFYLAYAREVIKASDFNLWSERVCPVCAQKPLMAKIRKDDSARILECRLCHTQWVFPRLECPFCENKSHKKMRYFYIDEVKGRRVNVCENCKSYIKTTILKDIGRDVILDIENLFTIQLDSVAQEEGYKPGQDLYLLN